MEEIGLLKPKGQRSTTYKKELKNFQLLISEIDPERKKERVFRMFRVISNS